jgi:surface protein
MASMFNGCKALKTLDLSNFDMTKVTTTTSMFSSCTRLTTLRLDNCSNATIKKIITNGGLPAFDAFSGGHYIYCKRANATDLTPPQGWSFSYVD